MKKQEETLAERIKQLRKEKKITQLELSELLNITDKAVSKWETDQGNPDISLLSKLSEIFDVTIDYLLMGKKPEEKVVLISKAEYCAKNDDIKLLDELFIKPPKPDENGYMLFDYIMKYNSVNVFKKLVEEKKLLFFVQNELFLQKDNRNNYYQRGVKRLVHNLVKTSIYDSYDILIMIIKTGTTSSLPMLGLGRIEDANYFEWDEKLYEYVIKGNLPKEILETIFTPSLGENGLWSLIYSKYLELAALNGDKDLLNYLFDKVKNINEETYAKLNNTNKDNIRYATYVNKDFEELEVSSKKSYVVDLTTALPFLKTVVLSSERNREYSQYRETVILFFVVLSKKTLEHIKTIDFDQLIKFNDFNKKLLAFHYNEKEMELIKMKVKKTHNDDEIFVHSCIDFGLLNVKNLIESPNLNLIKKALNSYPIHYYEILSELVRNKEYKKLFEISVDLNESSLREAILFEKYEQLGKIVYSLSTRLNEKSGLNIIQNQNLQFAEQLLLQDKHQGEKISDGKMLANHLQLCRKAIIKEVSWKIDAESLKKELTEKYFLDNLESNQDLVIIKLCLLLEAKFKIDYKLVGDLSELLTTYIRKEFYIEDDYYGRSGLRDEYIPDILQRLRIMRNNLLHSEKKNVKPLEKQELLDCIKHIIKM